MSFKILKTHRERHEENKGIYENFLSHCLDEKIVSHDLCVVYFYLTNFPCCFLCCVKTSTIY